MAITCEECKSLILIICEVDSDGLFNSSVSTPDEAHGVSNQCSSCGRQWVLVVTTLSYEGDVIPENAVLDDESDYPELSELEAREAMEGL